LTTSFEREVLENIKKAPYYSVRFQPATECSITMATARSIVQKDAVRMRGWDFPHYFEDTVGNAQKYLFNATSWSGHVELWRLYRSGQFVYLGAPWDLGMDHQPRLMKDFQNNVFIRNTSQKDDVVGVLSFVGMIYSITELHLFAARLGKSLDVTGFALNIGLHNIENWALVPGEPSVPWHAVFRAKVNEIRISSPDAQAVFDDPIATSAASLNEIFECFNWENSDAAIRSWQERFVAGRFAY
jgi:hypothetical protein